MIDSLRGKIQDADKEFKTAEESMKEAFEQKKEQFEQNKPDWMKKGLFAFDPEDDKKTNYTFEKEDNTDADEEPTTAIAPSPKRKHHHKKHHKPCMVIHILALLLIGAHLYQLRHLAKSLHAL